MHLLAPKGISGIRHYNYGSAFDTS